MTLQEKVNSENLRKIKIKDCLNFLEPTAVIELFELYYDVNLEPFRFHPGTNDLKEITWNEKKYYPIAVDTSEFETSMAGKLPRPRITIINKENIFSALLRDYSDLRDSKITRRKVLVRHLDAENFDNSINPFSNFSTGIYISYETFLLSQKISENKFSIQFELISPFDLQTLDSMNRKIIGSYCYWQYRGLGCNYSGDVICQEDDSDFETTSTIKSFKTFANSYVTKTNTVVSNYRAAAKSYLWVENFNYVAGDIITIENIDLNGKKDPEFTWFVCIKNHTSSYFLQPKDNSDYWQKDGCSKKISACKKRFKINSQNFDGRIIKNDSDVSDNSLRFGGFPGTEIFKYE